MDYIWGASVVETCLQMMTDLWEIGNKEGYDKEKVAKQQKRKAKAVISVWAMYKLRYQAQPSDVFLFYQDVAEIIEHAPATKLESFVVMRTRPINNSVNKLAERTACKVKSITEWIKTGGKNNKEVI